MSASDVLQESAIHGPVRVETEAKKKKRPSRQKSEEAASADMAAPTMSETVVGKQGKASTRLSGDQASLGATKKKRKKRAKKASEVPPSLAAQNAAAVPAH